MLGQALVEVFKKSGSYKIYGWDREEMDITDQEQVNEKISDLKPDVIINAAAYNAVDKCEKNKKEYELAKKVNGMAPGYLAVIAKKIGAIFVHYSTDYVFNGRPAVSEPEDCSHCCATCTLHKNFVPRLGFNENDRPKPISQYGKTKLMGEQKVKKEGGKYYMIRLSKLFGKPAKSKGAKKSFFDVMLEAGRKNEEVKVIDEETSCFTYAPDLAKKTKEIVESRKPYGIYHVVNSGSCTWYEAVLELYKQAKIKTKVIPVAGEEFPRPAKRPYFSVLLNTKINPLRDYREALKDYLKVRK